MIEELLDESDFVLGNYSDSESNYSDEYFKVLDKRTQQVVKYAVSLGLDVYTQRFKKDYEIEYGQREVYFKLPKGKQTRLA